MGANKTPHIQGAATLLIFKEKRDPVRYISSRKRGMLSLRASDHDPVLNSIVPLGMLDLVGAKAFCLGLIDLLSHALLFSGGMAVYHVIEPGSGHFESADIIVVGIIPSLFGSVFFWVEISHTCSYPALLHIMAKRLDDGVLVTRTYQCYLNPG